MPNKPVIKTSDDEEVEESTMPNKKNNKEDIEALTHIPDWLPDGWIMEVYREDDGKINRYYTSPVSGYTFTTEKEVLDYLISGEDELILKSKENTIQKEYQWLPKGWVIEARAGGKKMDKMYKFYAHSQTGARLVSKEDVLLHDIGAKISECDKKGQCDTSSEDNVLAKVELNPSGLPDGWVKEQVFIKITKERVRGDLVKTQNYTDPNTGYTFRSLKSSLKYLQTGIIPNKHAIFQEPSVHKLYCFDKYADLHERFRNGLKINANHGQNSEAHEIIST